MWGYLQSCCGTGGGATVYRYYTDNILMVEDTPQSVLLIDAEEQVALIDEPESLHVIDDDNSVQVVANDEDLTITDQPDRFCDD